MYSFSETSARDDISGGYMAFYAGRALQPVPAGWLSGAAGLGVSWKGTAWLPVPVLVWPG